MTDFRSTLRIPARGTIGHKVMLAVSPTLLIILMINIMYYSSARRQALDGARNLAGFSMHSTGETIGNYLDQQVQRFQGWVQEDIYGMSIEFDTVDDLVARFGEMLSTQDGITGLMLCDTDGTILRAARHRPADARWPTTPSHLPPRAAATATGGRACST